MSMDKSSKSDSQSFKNSREHSSWTLLVLAVMFGCSTTQPTSRGSAQTKPKIAYETATIDRFGHLYYAKTNNEIIKWDEHGDSMGYYTNNSFGDVSLIDATNPLKVLVYYSDFYTGVVLDRLLNETQVFNLLELGFGEVRTIGAAIDGAIWFFNDHEQRLIKATRQGQILTRGEDLRLRFNERILPDKIVQQGEDLIVMVPHRGLLLFDLFGQYKSQILDPQLVDFQVIAGYVLTRSSQNFKVYELKAPFTFDVLPVQPLDKAKMLFTLDQMVIVTGETTERKPWFIKD